MCGIAGVAGRTIKLPSASLLAHRGPDGHDSISIDLAGWPAMFHHTRLAIVDLTPAGDQPMVSADGRFAMLFNGEIYNHLELRALCEARGSVFTSNMDGEAILRLWELEGSSCLSRLNGIFAVAIADTASGELFLARDPLGVKPLVYCIDDDGSITFASEPTALARLGADIGGPDVEALGAFLTFLWVPNPLTPFRRARAVPVGQVLQWTMRGGVSLTTYRSIRPHPDQVTATSFQAAERELSRRLEVATQRQLLGDVPISVMASGGVDSSLVWSAGGDGIDKAFTIRWPKDEREGTDEDAVAVQRLEQVVGSPVAYIDGADAQHGYLPVSGDLYADPAFELTRLISRHVSADGRKVLLSGQGGDELFGGYRRHMVAPYLGNAFTGPIGEVLPRVLRRFGGGLSAEFGTRFIQATQHRDPFLRYMELCTYSSSAERARVLGCMEREVSNDVVFACHREVWESLPSTLSFLRKAMALDLSVYLPGLGLGYVDRAGMEFGVEIRVPWLDMDLVEWSFSLPDSLLVKRMRGKLLPKSLAGKLFPADVVDRPKRGFGAPTGSLATGTQRDGARGHRQGKYFALATNVLSQWLDSVPQASVAS